MMATLFDTQIARHTSEELFGARDSDGHQFSGVIV